MDLSSRWYNVPSHFQSCYLISSQTYILSYQRPLQKLKTIVTNLNGIMDKPIKIAFTKNFISIKINFRSWIYSTYFVYSFYCKKVVNYWSINQKTFKVSISSHQTCDKCVLASVNSKFNMDWFIYFWLEDIISQQVFSTTTGTVYSGFKSCSKTKLQTRSSWVFPIFNDGTIRKLLLRRVLF